MLETLCFLKRHKVIHLDIKPENIFLTREGNYILGDFGLAILEEEATSKDPGLTPPYCAPELVISRKFCSFAVDMWSTAATVCIIYGAICLFGEPRKDLIGFERIRPIFQAQQARFRKPYPIDLQKKAREKRLERILCDPSKFSQMSSFYDKMKRECNPTEEEVNNFNFLLDLLARMFDFDRQTRITPEEALMKLKEGEF